MPSIPVFCLLSPGGLRRRPGCAMIGAAKTTIQGGSKETIMTSLQRFTSKPFVHPPPAGGAAAALGGRAGPQCDHRPGRYPDGILRGRGGGVRVSLVDTFNTLMIQIMSAPHRRWWWPASTSATRSRRTPGQLPPRSCRWSVRCRYCGGSRGARPPPDLRGVFGSIEADVMRYAETYFCFRP